MERFSILVSSAGRRGALVSILRRTLTQLGLPGEVIAADQSLAAPAMHLADARVLVPSQQDPAFVDEVLAACVSRDVRLVVPTHDGELAAYAEAKQRFEAAGVSVSVSALATVLIGRDKTRTNAWLRQQGFPTVRQALPAAVLAHSDEWRFPLLTKPRHGSAGIGVARIADADALERRSRLDIVCEELAGGDEHTIDVLVGSRGRCLAAVPRRRIEVRAGEVSKGVTVHHPGLEDLATGIAESLPGAYGVLNIQVFLDAEGGMRVIEINPRYVGGFPLAWQAGAHLPRWTIEEVLGAPSSATRAFQDGLVMLRYDEAVFVTSSAAGL
jgi:carbamoyl-phosphate synthase large subunit